MRRPAAGEYATFYATYVDQVPDRPVLELLRREPARLEGLLAGLSPQAEQFAYAAGKWSIREVVGHVIDSERVFSFRALHMARADPAPLPGMDQEIWAAAANAGERPLASLLAEFRALRAANVELFSSFDDEALDRRGTASDCEFTVRALVYIIAGHQLHHTRVLAERYLTAQETGAGASETGASDD
jgi:uncharacterized damage-inducible protein DinB